MADLLKTGSTWLESQRVAHLTSAVAYQRSGFSQVVQATVGKTTFDLDDGGGGVIRVESRDYIVAIVDLAIGTPVVGDKIIDAGAEYEVADFGGEPCWRYSDPYRATIRIHTKQ